ncbi:hypothetical protein JOC77_003366 [Peribacillus deserti]|uniref:LXG domain-containing protein n=1 Tax=Peribacillus deserti TaxID=673318 RepID=A0ABS2QL75_9BACI|nr:hypothetical protein [Peribacillus deserti]MBM7693922.1 hypothetical protein [Peribacillus deserti]
MNNYDSLIRRYTNLHDNAFYLASQLSEVNKVLGNIEETLKKSLNGKRFIDSKGREGYIKTDPATEGAETPSGTESRDKICLVYDNNEVSFAAISSLKKITILD